MLLAEFVLVGGVCVCACLESAHMEYMCGCVCATAAAFIKFVFVMCFTGTEKG